MHSQIICCSNFTQKTSTCERCPSPLRTVRNINSNWRQDRNLVYILTHFFRRFYLFLPAYSTQFGGIDEVFVDASILYNIARKYQCKSVSSYLLININDLVLWPRVLEFEVFYLHLCFHLIIYLFIYLGFYVAFNTVQVISRRVVGRAEETSTYSSLGFCTVNCRPTASNYQLSHLRP